MKVEPIEKSITVPASPDRAFVRFTSEMERWWPADRHSVSAGQGNLPKSIVLDPRLGGAVTETLVDGRETQWGHIQRWDPPHGFSMTWHPGKQSDTATTLELTFEAEGDGTRVTLRHSGWDVLAEQADTIRGHYSEGWDYVVGTCYRQTFE